MYMYFSVKHIYPPPVHMHNVQRRRENDTDSAVLTKNRMEMEMTMTPNTAYGSHQPAQNATEAHTYDYIDQ